MAIQPEATKGGVTVLRNTKTGELAGSIGIGKDGVPSPREEVKNSQPENAEDKLSPIDIASKRYASHLEAIAPYTSATQRSDGAQPYEELAYNMARILPSDLDDIQFADVYRLLLNGVNKIKAEDLVDPTDQEWTEWIANVENRIVNDFDITDETRARLLLQLDDVKAGSKPSAVAYAILTRIEKKVWAAKYSLEEGYRQISAWFDTSPVEVKWQVNKFRKEYLEAIASGEELEVPAGYIKGYKFSSGSGPKDMATIYGHYMAENPELYDESAVPTRFVAFDTETTGLDSRTANVIQIGMVEYDHMGNETRRLVSYIRPPLNESGELSTGDEGAVEAHGIKPSDVANAPTFAELMPAIQNFFEGATVIGQNVIQFDSKHLAAEYIRASGGDKNAGKNLWNRAADTLWYAQRHLGSLNLGNNKLSTLNTHFGLPAFNAHDAGADAHATGLLFFHIRNEMKLRQREAMRKRREMDFWTV